MGNWTNIEDQRAWFRARYLKNVTRVRNIKLDRGCADCGYNEKHYVLEFDHVQPRLRGTVSSQMRGSWRMVEEEIARCEVVCANCHAERTWKRRQEEKVALERVELSLNA